MDDLIAKIRAAIDESDVYPPMLAKILELHSRSDDYPHECTTCGDFQDCGCARGNEGWPCPTLKVLAEAYGIEP